jgi:hypothetical protein
MLTRNIKKVSFHRAHESMRAQVRSTNSTAHVTGFCDLVTVTIRESKNHKVRATKLAKKFFCETKELAAKVKPGNTIQERLTTLITFSMYLFRRIPIAGGPQAWWLIMLSPIIRFLLTIVLLPHFW